MPCDEYGGKVSMTMRGTPVGSGQDAPCQQPGIPTASTWSQPDPAPQLLPAPASQSATAESDPFFFAPPRLEPMPSAPVLQTGFSQTGPTDNTVFAAYPGPRPFDPAYDPPYDPSSSVSPDSSLFTAPSLAVDRVDVPLAPIEAYDRPIRSRLRGMYRGARENIFEDHRNYYDRETMSKLAYGLVLGSVLANTSMDQDVRDWYQDDVRSPDTDDFAQFWKTFGEGHIFIPAFACLAFAGKLAEDRFLLGTGGEFGARTTRAYLVGSPPMLFMQFMLGASRPGETGHTSHWDPFQDTNSVSGHAFVGAVPFITAARMTDNFFLKSGLYACSTLTGFSRINDDQHYLSQVILGWWMAYLACEAVDTTCLNRQGMTFVPIASTEMVGFGAICEF